MPDESRQKSRSGQTGRAVRKLDRRSERTRRALHGAFTKLLLESGYEGLKVADILERADVGRSTFYQHYRGKEDLLRQSVTHMFAVLAETVTGSGVPPGLVAIVAHMRENRRLARALYRGAVRLLLSRRLAELIEPNLPAALILPRPLAARQIAEAQLGLLEAWLTGTIACRPEEIAAALHATSAAMALALAAA
ncbi:MAG TPA: TetR/AcrR family transcriptional regulator [Stellaceae bacterium]|nr:TetR/AcrR family transcriptional regulator [Stellaceae bacterium]